MSRTTLEDEFEALAAGMSPGQRALEAVVFYRACDLPVPDWALEEIESAYADFKHGAPASGFTRAALREGSPRSLGEAFGMAEHKGLHVRERRMKALMAPVVRNVFAQKRYPRTETGYAAAADALLLTPKQIKLWLTER